MTKCFNKFKKTLFLAHFWSIFPILDVNFFPENPTLSSTTSYWFLAPSQNLDKTNDNILRKDLHRQNGQKRTDGRMDRRTNRRTDRMTDEKTDGKTDRTHFEGPFPLELGAQ